MYRHKEDPKTEIVEFVFSLPKGEQEKAIHLLLCMAFSHMTSEEISRLRREIERNFEGERKPSIIVKTLALFEGCLTFRRNFGKNCLA